MSEKQVDIWEAIDEAEGGTPRTASEIADVLRALTPQQPFTRLSPREWTDLMIARRRVAKETGRNYLTERRDGEVTCALRPIVVAFIDLRPGDVLWPDGEVVEVVHRRDGLARMIARPQGGWSPDWVGKDIHATVLARGKVTR